MLPDETGYQIVIFDVWKADPRHLAVTGGLAGIDWPWKRFFDAGEKDRPRYTFRDVIIQMSHIQKHSGACAQNFRFSLHISGGASWILLEVNDFKFVLASAHLLRHDKLS